MSSTETTKAFLWTSSSINDDVTSVTSQPPATAAGADDTAVNVNITMIPASGQFYYRVCSLFLVKQRNRYYGLHRLLT